MPVAKKVEIHIDKLPIETVKTKIRGTAPLILHPITQETLEDMLSRMKVDKKKMKREEKNPKKEFEESLAMCIVQPGKLTYVDNKRDIGLGKVEFSGTLGIFSRKIKASMINAVRQYDNLTMTGMKQLLRVYPTGQESLIPITYRELRMREDALRNQNSSMDLRYRPEIIDWEAEITIEYNSAKLTAGMVLNLLNAAGWCCGIEENRPQKSGGSNGTFEVCE